MGPAPRPSPPLPSLAQRGGAPEALRKTEKQKPVLISKAKLGCGPLSVTHRRRNCQEPAKCQRCQHRVPVWAGPQGENPSHVPSRGRPALGQLGPEIPWHLSKTPADLCFPAKFRFPLLWGRLPPWRSSACGPELRSLSWRRERGWEVLLFQLGCFDLLQAQPQSVPVPSAV